MSTETELHQPVVLIIDDNASNRLLLSSQLELHNFKILEASDGRQGIVQAETHFPDLILLDVMMPFMDGFETCRQLKGSPSTRHIPVIMITALRDVKDRIEGMKAGADEFLSRPHNREELLIRVNSLIKLKQARDKLEEERNRLELLYEVTRASTQNRLDLEKTISEVLVEIQKAFGATKGSLIFRDSNGEITHHLSIKENGVVLKEPSIDPNILSNGLAGRIITRNESEIIQDVTDDPRWLTLPHDQVEIGSAIGVPLIDNLETRGALILTHLEKGYFSEEQKQLLEAIANQVTIAIHNAYLFNQVDDERSKLEAILAQSSDAIIVTNETYHIEMINEAALKAFNLERNVIIETRLQHVPAFSQLQSLLDETKLSSTQEIQGANKQTYLASVTPIQGVGFSIILQDVTEQKLHEEMRLEAERYKTAHVKRTFSQYMSPNIVDRLLEDPEAMNNKRIWAVVLFADLRNSTGMILNQEPSLSMKTLNDFFSAMTNIVHQNEGTIFDMLGDELMIAFNAPLDQPDAPARAIQTAYHMQVEFSRLRAAWLNESNIDLGLGIGIDMGYVVMGNIGREETRLNFGLVGGAINMGKRLVDIATDREIVISEAVYAEIQTFLHSETAATLGKIEFNSEENVDLKGNPKPQRIYRTLIET